MNILYIIYGASIPTSWLGFMITARISQVAFEMGKTEYIIKGLILSLIPVLNTLLAVGTIIELTIKDKKK